MMQKIYRRQKSKEFKDKFKPDELRVTTSPKSKNSNSNMGNINENDGQPQDDEARKSGFSFKDYKLGDGIRYL